jgi:radical SAM protein with 4Fe4S-binding SPASM domain
MIATSERLRILPPIYRQPRERYLYFYVTNECNLRCKHCYVGNERLNKADRFDLERADQILDYFSVIGGHDKMYILGGEPTLHPQLHDLVNMANQKGYRVTISSNGDFPESVFERITPAMLASFNFSLESADPAIHARIRGNRGNFKAVTSKISSARALGYQVRVMCTVSKANCDNALDLIPFVAGLGAHTLSFHNLGLTGNAATHLTPLTPVEWMEFCRNLEAHEPEPRLAVYYPPTFVAAEEQLKWSERGYPGCPARTLDRPHVYPDGTVYACPLMMDGQRHYARFQNGGLVINPDPASELNAYLKLDNICIGCPSHTTCGGGCPAFSAMTTYEGDQRYQCDRAVTPICMLWTTHAWSDKPAERLHEFR